MRHFRTAVFATVLLGSATLASANIAFSNFGSSFSFGAGAWSIGKLVAFPNAQIQQGFQFTALDTGNVSAIYVAVQTVVGENSSGAAPTFDLYTDSSNTVGTLMGTWTGTTVGSPAVQTLTGGSASLAAGTKYWLMARETSSTFAYGWTLNNQSSNGLRARSGNSGLSYAYDTQPQGAFRIDVSPTSVPEPFTTALMGGSAIVGFRRLRRRRRA